MLGSPFPRVPLCRPTCDRLNPWPQVCGWLLTELWPCRWAGPVLWGRVRSPCTVLVCLLVARRGPMSLCPHLVWCLVHPVITCLCRNRWPTPSAPVTLGLPTRSWGVGTVLVGVGMSVPAYRVYVVRPGRRAYETATEEIVGTLIRK